MAVLLAYTTQKNRKQIYGNMWPCFTSYIGFILFLKIFHNYYGTKSAISADNSNYLIDEKGTNDQLSKKQSVQYICPSFRHVSKFLVI